MNPEVYEIDAINIQDMASGFVLNGYKTWIEPIPNISMMGTNLTPMKYKLFVEKVETDSKES